MDAVKRINKTCLPENYPKFFFVEIWKNFPEGFNVAETEKGERVVGYCMSRIEKGFSNFGFGITKKGHIISIAVLKEHRRRGIAYQLMESVTDALRMKNIQEIFLEVRESNQSAINLYQKLGYQQIKISKRYYHDGESAIIMARKI